MNLFSIELFLLERKVTKGRGIWVHVSEFCSILLLLICQENKEYIHIHLYSYRKLFSISAWTLSVESRMEAYVSNKVNSGGKGKWASFKSEV